MRQAGDSCADVKLAAMANLNKGQVRQVGAYLLIIDARTLVTTERDLEKGLHVVVWGKLRVVELRGQ